MNPHHARQTLSELVRLGVRWRVRGGRVQFPRDAVVPKALRLRVRQGSVELLVLLAERDAVPAAKSPKPRESTAEAPRHERRCYACNSATFWSLLGGGNWVCATCHPSGRHPGDVDWHVVQEPAWLRHDEPAPPDRRSEPIHCLVCRGTRFLWYADKRWTVCPRCNSGFDGEGGAA